VLDFGKLFLDQEADDEEATSLVEMLHALGDAMASRSAAVGRRDRDFKAADVARNRRRLEVARDVGAVSPDLPIIDRRTGRARSTKPCRGDYRIPI
jgi:hypothetical protein